MVGEVLEHYGIDPGTSQRDALVLLEKERQKTLRKLNHVFGNPAKEKELEEELDRLEEAIEELEKAGGPLLSLDDVTVETRSLSQTQMDFEEAEQVAEIIEIRKLEKALLAEGTDVFSMESFRGVYRLIHYYQKRGSYTGMEKWLNYGVQWFHYKDFFSMLYRVCRDRQDGLEDPGKTRYWARRAADIGDKDASYAMGVYCAQPGGEMYDLKKAAFYFAQAADREHPRAYLSACAAFYKLRDYKKAETCLLAADKNGVLEAAYRLALMYEVDENSEGRRNPQKALSWYEKAYRQKPDGDICLGLGELYAELGRRQEAVAVLLRGKTEFHSEECSESLLEMTAS